MEENPKGKIGVFDSGFGGLSILKEIVKELPEYEYLYLGDTARAPYGTRPDEEIFEFTKQSVDFLFKNGAEIIILACNTASSEALRKIQQEYLPVAYPNKKVLGVIIPTAEEAVHETKNNRIGVLATEATIRSKAFEREIQKINSTIQVFGVPAPLLVPIIENGEDKTPKAEEAVKNYVNKLLEEKVDTIILGCTHYSVLESLVKKFADPSINVLCEEKFVAKKLADYLNRHKEMSSRFGKVLDKTEITFFTTGEEQKFNILGSRFFGVPVVANKVSI